MRANEDLNRGSSREPAARPAGAESALAGGRGIRFLVLSVFWHLVLLAAAGSALPAGAAEYTVAPAGSDTAAGTRAQPFRSLQHAADVMQPGDTCVIRAGTYR